MWNDHVMDKLVGQKLLSYELSSDQTVLTLDTTKGKLAYEAIGD